MAEDVPLVKTLVFQLNCTQGNEGLLEDATFEARWVYNETIRLAKSGLNRAAITDRMVDNADLVKNTTQCIVAKALGAMENYVQHDTFNLPSHTKESPYPLRANYEEGYNLTLTDDGGVGFRISAKPYEHVKGKLSGSETHLNILTIALTSGRWKLTTAEALWRDGDPELHVTVTNTEQSIRDKRDSRTIIGVDVNEDNVALSAISDSGIEDSLVIDFPEIKFERHRYFTMRKRVQNAGKERIHNTLEGREERFVRDRLHKVSRHIVDWTCHFERPSIVFEDLKSMRDSIDYGTRMNRRLHHLPFHTLQFYTSYKAAFEGIPTGWIDPEYTSQRCPLCGHTERPNRKRKRFKCRSCSHQDHADRSASINIAVEGIEEHQAWNVPALNNLPTVRKVRRQASGAVDAPTVTLDTVRGHHTDGVAGVLD